MNKKINNHVGQRFGSLVVLSLNLQKKTNNARWDCLCDCGEKRVVWGYSLVAGNTRSCGGPKHRIRSLPGESGFKACIARYRGNANARKLDFTLTEEECRVLFEGKCAYCGSPPYRFYSHSPCHNPSAERQKNSKYFFNGIDRIDSNSGYATGNVVSCCKLCNFAKQELTVDEFLTHIRKILDYQQMEKNDRH